MVSRLIGRLSARGRSIETDQVSISRDLSPASSSVRDVRFLDTLHFEEDRGDEAEAVHGGADRFCVAAARVGDVGGVDHAQGGISEQSFYCWKRKYGGLGVTDLDV
jgi:hypothetical protein